MEIRMVWLVNDLEHDSIKFYSLPDAMDYFMEIVACVCNPDYDEFAMEMEAISWNPNENKITAIVNNHPVAYMKQIQV